MAHACGELDILIKTGKRGDHKLKLMGGSPFNKDAVDIVTEDDQKPQKQGFLAKL